MCGDDGDAGGVGVLAVGVRLSRYAISWNVRVFSWLSTFRINVVGGKSTDAVGSRLSEWLGPCEAKGGQQEFYYCRSGCTDERVERFALP